MYEYMIHTLPNLPASVRTFWEHCVTHEKRCGSPCFSPTFVEAFHAVGRKVEILSILHEGEVVGLLPLERDFWNMSQPVGKSLADFQGVISCQPLNLPWSDMLRACGLRGWKYATNIDVQTAPGKLRTWMSPVLDLSNGFEQYCRGRKAAGSETVEKSQQKMRAWQRTGNVRFDLRNNSAEQLAQLFTWKQQQYQARNLSVPLENWKVPQLWRYWIDHRTDHFEGFLSALWWNDQPTALAYSIRHGSSAHCAFIAYDRTYSKYSPGLLLLLKLAEGLASEGVYELHLGRGEERFKSSLATHAWEVAEGVIGASPWQTNWLQSWEASRHRMKNSAIVPWIRSLRAIVSH
jgi:CelD/BcsL family acetyltransferase involved in cellulose biosynthesis